MCVPVISRRDAPNTTMNIYRASAGEIWLLQRCVLRTIRVTYIGLLQQLQGYGFFRVTTI